MPRSSHGPRTKSQTQRHANIHPRRRAPPCQTGRLAAFSTRNCFANCCALSSLAGEVAAFSASIAVAAYSPAAIFTRVQPRKLSVLLIRSAVLQGPTARFQEDSPKNCRGLQRLCIALVVRCPASSSGKEVLSAQAELSDCAICAANDPTQFVPIR